VSELNGASALTTWPGYCDGFASAEYAFVEFDATTKL
jgi:hypothetical protein